MIEVINTEKSDLEQIFELFDHSINYQEKKGVPVWRNYDKNALIKDIEEKNQYKVVIDSKLSRKRKLSFWGAYAARVLVSAASPKRSFLSNHEYTRMLWEAFDFARASELTLRASRLCRSRPRGSVL